MSSTQPQLNLKPDAGKHAEKANTSATPSSEGVPIHMFPKYSGSQTTGNLMAQQKASVLYTRIIAVA